MRFKQFMETIDVPPHLPLQFYQEHMQAFEHIKKIFEDMKKLKDDNFYDFARDFLYGEDRHAIDNAVNDLPRWMWNKIERVHENLKWALTSDDKDYQNKFIKYSANESLLKDLTDIEFEPIQIALTNLEREIKDSEKDWSSAEWDNSEWGDFQQRLGEVNQIKTFINSLKKMKGWYKVYIDKTLAFDSLDRRRAASYYASGQADRHAQPPTGKIETLYHATTAVGAILRDGFKTRAELGGRSALGGGPADVISFTSDVQIAEAIVYALRRAVECATGRMTFQQLQLLGNKMGGWDQAMTHMKSSWGHQDHIDSMQDFKLKRTDRTEDERREWMFKAFSALLTFQSKIYNPWFAFVTAKDFEKVDPSQIGIIGAEVQMEQVKEYLSSMEEYRVPIPAIGKVWKVAYTGVMKPQVRY